MPSSPGTTPPTSEEWRRLFAAAAEYNQLAPWKWMVDTDIFGVQNPEDGEIGYCCVLGNLGEYIGLTVYRGSEGFDVYWKNQTGELGPGNPEVIFRMFAITFSMSDREELEKEDLQVVRDLGLKFRGRNAWPMFRSYIPGYAPWLLNAAEARVLAVAIEQSIDMATRYRDNKNLLQPPQSGLYLVRIPETGDSGLTWRDEWIKPEPFEQSAHLSAKFDPARLQGVGQKIERREGIWEFNFEWAEMPIAEPGQRPRYPVLGLLASHESGMILGNSMAEGTHRLEPVIDSLLRAIEQTRTAPQEIWVKKAELLDLLRPLADALSIRIQQVHKLPQESAIRSHLLSLMGPR